jgi:hypothetical protein
MNTHTTQSPSQESSAASGTHYGRRQMDDMLEIRDRLARTETNHQNLKEQFSEFKVDTQGEFNTLTKKIDLMMEQVGTIKVTIARYVGGCSVLIFLAELLLKKLT